MTQKKKSGNATNATYSTMCIDGPGVVVTGTEIKMDGFTIDSAWKTESQNQVKMRNTIPMKLRAAL